MMSNLIFRQTFATAILILFICNAYSMNVNPGDTLTLKGKIVKENMQTKKGTRLEGVQDYYFVTANRSYFIKTAVGEYSNTELEKYVGKLVTVNCMSYYGTWDIASDDPSYAATRMGDYILIISIVE